MPQILSEHPGSDQRADPNADISVVFVCRKNLPDIMTSSLPLLIATSALPATRAKLIDVSTQAEEQIARALDQPRVGVLGMDAHVPGAETMLRFLQDNIASVDVPWLDQAPAPSYHSVKINTVLSTSKLKTTAQSRERKSPKSG